MLNAPTHVFKDKSILLPFGYNLLSVLLQAQLQPSVNSTAGVAVNGNVQLNMAGQVNVVATANASSTVSPDLILTKRTKVSQFLHRPLQYEELTQVSLAHASFPFAQL